MPPEMLRTLARKMKLLKGDNLIPGARYHNFKDFMSFPKVGLQLSTDPQPEPLPHPDIQPSRSLFSLIRNKDVLLHYPYQTFHYLIDLLREAAIDPNVVSIKMTLYRLASQSNVVNALINAVRNGKMVTAVVELQARFDEEANIFWANQLREEGAKVIFGVPHMKVHSKLCVITRKEKGQSVRYGYIGTGNFNEGTARLYSDQGLLTSNNSITEELNQVFGFLDNNFKTGTYRHILLSPFYMRNALVALINKEMSNARIGLPAYMILKMNSLVDPDMIEKLYEASQAGVKIRLIIRGICSLKAGVEGLSENIEAISIVDKYLEHSRIFVFGNGGEEKIYFGSADWMTRNLDHRVEVLCPVYDKAIQAEFRAFLCIQLLDNTKARLLDAEQRNAYVYEPDKPKVRSQDEFYILLKSALQEGHSIFSKYDFSMFGITEGKPVKVKKKKKKAKAGKKKASKLQSI
jgi:polyphosphate kinase